MREANFNVSSMNYTELQNLAKTIELKGETIYDSLNHIKSLFEQMREEGFAGTTLTTVLQTLDKISSLPSDVKQTCEQFKQYADRAIAEVTTSETEVLQTLRLIINADPTRYEMPGWYVTNDATNQFSANDIV